MIFSLLLTLFLGTFVSEDLASVSAGLLIAAGRVPAGLAMTAVFLGIFASDLGLYLLGRGARAGLWRWTWVQARLKQRQWVQQRGWLALLLARFLPGTRLPVYLLAGFAGYPLLAFAGWTFLVGLVWTPLLVGGVALAGLAMPTAGLVLVVLLLLGLRLAPRASGRFGWARLQARVSRLWRWEFWPAWLFYLPLIPWYLWLALRHRGLTVWTACNPGIPAGGVVGESKFAILAQLPARWTVPTTLLPPGPAEERLHLLTQTMQHKGWSYPLILKPDVSERGAGVKRVVDDSAALAYFQVEPAAVLAQPYHPGPFEAGIFYYRIPGQERGRIFSITDKRFPILVGDGRSTLEELVWQHPRYRMQSATFLARHAQHREQILRAGEEFRLALAGNHCQGTAFHDGAHLITPELEARIEEIARGFPGFFIGRFDVRYSDVPRFQAGQDLAIVELNGATSESTNLYDPTRGLIWAYAVLFRQWSLLFRIGAANRARGHRPVGLFRLVRLVLEHHRGRRPRRLAD